MLTRIYPARTFFGSYFRTRGDLRGFPVFPVSIADELNDILQTIIRENITRISAKNELAPERMPPYSRDGFGAEEGRGRKSNVPLRLAEQSRRTVEPEMAVRPNSVHLFQRMPGHDRLSGFRHDSAISGYSFLNRSTISRAAVSYKFSWGFCVNGPLYGNPSSGAFPTGRVISQTFLVQYPKAGVDRLVICGFAKVAVRKPE